MPESPTDADRLAELSRLYAESQEALAEAERGRTEADALLRFYEAVSGIVSHDLKNPLAAILMNARLLRAADTERAGKIGARIVASADRMSRMIDQVGEWIRMRAEVGGIQLSFGSCDLGAVTEQVVADLRARKPNATIDVARRGELRGQWDADRIARVLSNVVGNALDHASAPGVQVALDGEDAAVVTISVTNKGSIDEAVRGVLFEPFRGRASGGAKLPGRGGGLGLGLYIARRIVLAHGGHLEVVAGGDGQVAFVTTLPRTGRGANSLPSSDSGARAGTHR